MYIQQQQVISLIVMATDTDKMLYLKTVFVLISLFYGSLAVERSVSTPIGTIIGNTETVTYGATGQFSGDITTFLGIPYAEPPTGERRFARPVSKANFTTAFAATQFGASCPQLYEPQIAPTDEDCLFLNIYTPDTTGDVAGVPVMIFIHGGGFRFGDGKTFGSEKLVAYTKVVVVTFNYRLGALGFLDVGNAEISSNNGLRDQQLAIKWVHENINSFGGDPNQITIFGESAGAVSVILQTLYADNDGLFQRAIALSGTATNPWATVDVPMPLGWELALSLDCSLTDQTAMVTCLKEYSNITEFTRLSNMVGNNFRPKWGPTKDGVFVSDIQLKELHMPTGNVQLPLFQKVDLMIGTNGFEAYMAMLQTFPEYANESLSADDIKNLNEDLFATILSGFLEDTSMLFNIRDTVMNQYKVDDPKDKHQHLFQAISFLNDVFYILGTTATVHKHNMNGTSKTYQYEYNQLFPYPFALPSWVTGAVHGAGLGYMFGFPDGLAAFYRYTQQQVQPLWPFASKVMDYLTNFAKTGNPSANWKEYTSTEGNYYYLTSDLQEGRKHLYKDRVNFWMKTFPTLVTQKMTHDMSTTPKQEPTSPKPDKQEPTSPKPTKQEPTSPKPTKQEPASSADRQQIISGWLVVVIITCLL